MIVVWILPSEFIVSGQRSMLFLTDQNITEADVFSTEENLWALVTGWRNKILSI